MTERFELMINTDEISRNGRVYPKEVLMKAMQDAVDNQIPVFLENGIQSRRPTDVIGSVIGYNPDTNKILMEIDLNALSDLSKKGVRE